MPILIDKVCFHLLIRSYFEGDGFLTIATMSVTDCFKLYKVNFSTSTSCLLSINPSMKPTKHSASIDDSFLTTLFSLNRSMYFAYSLEFLLESVLISLNFYFSNSCSSACYSLSLLTFFDAPYFPYFPYFVLPDDFFFMFFYAYLD